MNILAPYLGLWDINTNRGVEVFHHCPVGMEDLAPYLAFADVGENGPTAFSVLFDYNRGFLYKTFLFY